MGAEKPARRAGLAGFLARLTLVFRAIGVFWPSAVLVILLFVFFCWLPVGRDVVQLAKEGSFTLPWVLLALVFCAFIAWFTGRWVSYFFPDPMLQTRVIRTHLPRFLGFSVFTVMAMAYILPTVAKVSYRLPLMIAVLIASVAWYAALIRGIRKYRAAGHSLKWVLLVASTLVLVMVISSLCPGASEWKAVASILLMQFIFIGCVVAHREHIRRGEPLAGTKAQAVNHPMVKGFLDRLEDKLEEQPRPKHRPAARMVPSEPPDLKREASLFLVFNAVAFVALGIFATAGSCLQVAQAIRPLPIALTGLAMVFGGINLVRFVGRWTRINFLFWIVLLSLLLGECFDAHRVHLVIPERAPDERPCFTKAAGQWMDSCVKDPRNSSLDKDHRIPMVFVLSDGGAVRSAQWVGHVLGHLDKNSHGRFRQQLFAMSGASGGSVGNLVYYGLLSRGSSPDSIRHDAIRVLGNDMLSFTLARMLGSDLLNLAMPILGDKQCLGNLALNDRAAALEDGLAEAGRSAGLELETAFLDLVDQRSNMPLLCLNTTRVQDAKPAVISSFQFKDDAAFSGRLDLLAEMPRDSTFRANSAAILSARFPYVSPAGSLPVKYEYGDSGRTHWDAFVDGGYFDNSGAGLVLEMLMALENTEELKQQFRRFKPVVIHLSNGDPCESHGSGMNSVLNDVLAPMMTIVGAYGKQTDVNNRRLKHFLDVRGAKWVEINLFQESELGIVKTIKACESKKEYYPMSWALSDGPSKAMEERGRMHPEVGRWSGILDGWRGDPDWSSKVK